MKLKCLGVLLLASMSAHAGFNGLTMHSRANCINNESITWDATQKRWMMTTTEHYKQNKYIDGTAADNAYSRRSAAVHWREGFSGGWHVRGRHYMTDGDRGRIISGGGTQADDCSMYDGWWEFEDN